MSERTDEGVGRGTAADPSLDFEIIKPQQRRCTVAGRTLVIEPVPLGEFKRIVALGRELEQAGRGDQVEAQVETLSALLSALLKDEAGEAIPPGWFEQHLTLPAANQLASAALEINGLKANPGE